MFKIVALIGLGAVLALPPGVALAQQGTSSSYGTEGWGPRIPTIARKTGPSGSAFTRRRANIRGFTEASFATRPASAP